MAKQAFVQQWNWSWLHWYLHEESQQLPSLDGLYWFGRNNYVDYCELWSCCVSRHAIRWRRWHVKIRFQQTTFITQNTQVSKSRLRASHTIVRQYRFIIITLLASFKSHVYEPWYRKPHMYIAHILHLKLKFKIDLLIKKRTSWRHWFWFWSTLLVLVLLLGQAADVQRLAESRYP